MSKISSEDFFQRVEDRRSEMGISDSALSREATGSKDTLRLTRNRGGLPDLNNLSGLARVLGVSTDWLLNGRDSSPTTAPEDIDSATHFNLTKAGLDMNISDPQEIVINNPYMEPRLKRDSTVLYDGSVRTIDEPGIYVFKVPTGLIALNAEPVLFSDPPKIRIWGDNGFKEIFIDLNQQNSVRMALLGRVRLWTQTA